MNLAYPTDIIFLLNVKGVGAGIYEYRIDFGPDYRIGFGKDGDRLVI